MEEIYFRKVMTSIILAALIVLSFLLVKPILLSIIFGILLAFLFTPVYNWFYKIIKSKNISAFLICFLLILLIVLPLWFLTPVIIDQSIKIYISSQQMDFVKPLKNIFPAFFSSEEFSTEIGSIIHSFVTKSTNKLMNSLSTLILNFPTIFLQSIVVFFTLFFVLRDKEEMVSYIKSLLPFSKEVEGKLFKLSENITSSVIYGQIVIGIIQGLILGLGLFIFNVPNALILTLLACLVGVFPIIGVAIIWVPVIIYLFIAGNTFPAFGIMIFGLISSSIDNFIRPIIVSKRTQMPLSLILIGMIGGLFLFGILGLILGPLIFAYLLIILEIYRNKKTPSILTQQP